MDTRMRMVSADHQDTLTTCTMTRLTCGGSQINRGMWMEVPAKSYHTRHKCQDIQIPHVGMNLGGVRVGRLGPALSAWSPIPWRLPLVSGRLPYVRRYVTTISAVPSNPRLHPAISTTNPTVNPTFMPS